MLNFPLPLLSNKQSPSYSTPTARDKGLSVSEQCALSCGLEEIRVNEKFYGTQFWGKVEGLRCDYLIIDAVQPLQQGGAHKYFYSADQGLSWLQLPSIEPWMHDECLKVASQRFTGITSHIWSEMPEDQLAAMARDEAALDQRTGFDKLTPAAPETNENDDEDDDDQDGGDDPDAEQAEDDGEEEDDQGDPQDGADNEDEKDNGDQDPSAKDAADQGPIVEEIADEDLSPPQWFEQRLTELHRLSWTVRQISDECFLVPKGSLMLTSNKKFVWKDNWTGLSRVDALSLASYLHFRRPQTVSAQTVFAKATASNDDDFLDIITEDMPRNVWRLKTKSASSVVSVTNLLWSGFEFTYDLRTKGFSQYYFGNGTRKSDIIYLM